MSDATTPTSRPKPDVIRIGFVGLSSTGWAAMALKHSLLDPLVHLGALACSLGRMVNWRYLLLYLGTESIVLHRRGLLSLIAVKMHRSKNLLTSNMCVIFLLGVIFSLI